MEKVPVCKVRNDIKSFELLEEQIPKKNFIFEPQHFRNYKKLLPNSAVRFYVNHTVTDKDLPEVYKFFERQKKNIAVEVEMVVNITYYNLAPIMESKMYKELRRLAFNPGVIYEPFMLKENNYGIFMFYKYDFPQRLEVAKSKWNQRVMYTKTIPKKFQHLFKPEDFVIVQTRDNYKNIVLFKFPWDLPLPVFKKFYGKKVGVPNLIFYFYGCRIGSGNYNETMRTFQRFKRGELNLPNIIEIAPELYG
uniref:Uncharacterized protein n=1 Tax=Panagrolaimus davidi TaxID=227884 RepID=A0A914Q602_9BILA